MKKLFFLAAISLSVACNTSESNESDGQLNTPPTGATDTSGGGRTDTSHATDSLSGTHRTGQDSAH